MCVSPGVSLDFPLTENSLELYPPHPPPSVRPGCPPVGCINHPSPTLSLLSLFTCSSQRFSSSRKPLHPDKALLQTPAPWAPQPHWPLFIDRLFRGDLHRMSPSHCWTELREAAQGDVWTRFFCPSNHRTVPAICPANEGPQRCATSARGPQLWPPVCSSWTGLDHPGLDSNFHQKARKSWTDLKLCFFDESTIPTNILQLVKCVF